MNRHLAPLFAFCLLASCRSPTAVTQDFDFGQAFWLAPGQEALSADGSTVVQVTRVTDSYCREGMLCIWQGELVAEVTVRLLPSSTSQSAELHSELEPRTVNLNMVGRSISLLEVGHVEGSSPQEPRFRLKFRVNPSSLR